MSDNGSVYTCPNHPNLRWFNTKPGGRLCFVGEIPNEEHPNGRDAAMSTLPWVKILKARLNGVNPYDPSIPEEPTTKWSEVMQFVEYVQAMEVKYVAECECSDQIVNLTKTTGETYETMPRTIHEEG